MKTTCLSLVFLVAVVAFPAAPSPAQSTDTMERPVWNVGDRWVQSVSREPGGWRGREVSTVVRIADFDGVPAYYLQFDIDWTDGGGNRRREQFVKIRDKNLTPIGYTDQQGRVLRRLKADWLRWPLVVGTSWHVEGSEEILTRSSWISFRASTDVFVKRTEEIKTPAGTFTTFLVSSVHRRLDDSGRLVDQGLEDDWISPQARIWAKYSYKGTAGSEEGELVEYRPAP